MKLIKHSDLYRINGAGDYMCVYSLIQYQNARFDMLDDVYQTNEDSKHFKQTKQSVELYRSWMDQYCSQEVITEFTGI